MKGDHVVGCVPTAFRVVENNIVEGNLLEGRFISIHLFMQ